MKTKLAVAAAFLVSAAMASDAFGANMWRTNHGHNSGGSSSGGGFVSSTPDGSNPGGNDSNPGGNDLGVPEPSALYALGSGLVLLGAAGWALRRRK